ncbi:hypothetical protein F4819DRAFT_484129 [Hypoxylon fuscum]|nr:hypothetical protein F4819DRAFT_484129 [Hypoxylon fuscum]
MRTQTLILFVAPVALAATPRARSGLPKSLAQSNLLNVLATCEAGYVTCENGCMPSSGTCCNDNTDEYCLASYYCIPGACCPDGEICSGSSSDDASCGISETECGDLCMPLTGTCCGDGLHYCPDFGTCTSDGYCCDIGDDCDSSSGSSGSSSSDFTQFTTASDDDDFTSTTSRTTTRTTTTTIDDDSTSTTRTRSSTSSTTTSESSSTSSSNTVTVTPAPGATVTATVSQPGAGGIFTADGRIAAGLAVVAALLV